MQLSQENFNGFLLSWARPIRTGAFSTTFENEKQEKRGHRLRIRNNSRKRNIIIILCSVAAGIIVLTAAVAAAITYSKVDVTRDIPDRHPPTLFDPDKKEIAMKLVSSAENSSTDWQAQYAYIEDIGDNRGYTGGIIGFTSGTSDMLKVVQYYTQLKPDNILAKYIPALKKVVGTASHEGLDPTFVADWKTAAKNDPIFRQAQDHERDTVYFNPSVTQAQADGLGALGQFIYYDAMVMHGPGDDPVSFGGIRAAAMAKAKTPAQGGDETEYLNAFLDARKAAMAMEAARWNTSRIDTEQRVFLQQGNLALDPPLVWKVSGADYAILQ